MTLELILMFSVAARCCNKLSTMLLQKIQFKELQLVIVLPCKRGKISVDLKLFLLKINTIYSDHNFLSLTCLWCLWKWLSPCYIHQYVLISVPVIYINIVLSQINVIKEFIHFVPHMKIQIWNFFLTPF